MSLQGEARLPVSITLPASWLPVKMVFVWCKSIYVLSASHNAMVYYNNNAIL